MSIYCLLTPIFFTIFGIAWLQTALPYIFGAFWIGICVVIYRTQRAIWKIDMDIRKQQEQNAGE